MNLLCWFGRHDWEVVPAREVQGDPVYVGEGCGQRRVGILEPMRPAMNFPPGRTIQSWIEQRHFVPENRVQIPGHARCRRCDEYRS